MKDIKAKLTLTHAYKVSVQSDNKRRLLVIHQFFI